MYGAGAFDPDSTRAPEWERFGGHYFFLPTLEVVEGARCAVVACAVVWDASIMSSDGMDGDYLPIQTTKYDDDSGENAPPVTTKSHANSVTCSRDLAQAVALCADAIESALGESVGSFTKDGYEKMVTGIHKTVPPNAATLVTKTLEPDQQGWHRLVDKLLVSLRTGERHERGTASGLSPSPASTFAHTRLTLFFYNNRRFGARIAWFVSKRARFANFAKPRIRGTAEYHRVRVWRNDQLRAGRVHGRFRDRSRRVRYRQVRPDGAFPNPGTLFAQPRS